MTKVKRISVSSIHTSDGFLVMATANGILCLCPLPNICRPLQRMIHPNRAERRKAKVKLGRQKLVFVQ